MQFGIVKTVSDKIINNIKTKIITAEIRKNQLVTAQLAESAGEASGIMEGDFCLLAKREQAVGGFFAFLNVDHKNFIEVAPGEKILYARDQSGRKNSSLQLKENEILLQTAENQTIISFDDNSIVIKTGSIEITLKNSEITLKNANSELILTGTEVKINQGTGIVLEASRLQPILTAFAALLQAEFVRVQAGCLPNPAVPYVPSPFFPLDIAPAQSPTIKIP